MAFVKVEQALIPHFSKLQRQSAALHTEVIRKLLLRHVFPYARFLEPCAYKCVVYHTNKSPADEVFLLIPMLLCHRLDSALETISL